MLLEPEHHSGCAVDSCGKTAHAVPLLRVRHQNGSDTILQKGVVKLECLLRRSAPVEGTADIESRSSDMMRIHHRAAREILSAAIVIAIRKKQAHKVRNVRDEVLGDEVGYW